jgi:pyridoxal phosphate enzyme (YggS family)
VIADVGEAAERAGRSSKSVTLVAVSKTVDRDLVDEAYRFGLRHFGENRIQDAANKFSSPLPGDASLHMIGQLQTNKAKYASKLFQIIESVDRESLAVELEKQASKIGTVLPVLMQVNIAGEAQKAGCEPHAAAELAELISNSEHLDLQGLMTIAPLVSDPEEVRPVFRGLCQLRARLQERFQNLALDTLSMGMSNDYRVAIEEGATMVRIGRAIFEGN